MVARCPVATETARQVLPERDRQGGEGRQGRWQLWLSAARPPSYCCRQRSCTRFCGHRPWPTLPPRRSGARPGQGMLFFFLFGTISDERNLTFPSAQNTNQPTQTLDPILLEIPPGPRGQTRTCRSCRHRSESETACTTLPSLPSSRRWRTSPTSAALPPWPGACTCRMVATVKLERYVVGLWVRGFVLLEFVW